MTSQPDPNVTVIYNQFKSWVDGTQELNTSTLIILIPKIMKCAEEQITAQDKGAYKKSVVLQVLKLIINDSILTAEAKEALKLLVDTVVPTMIDTMVMIAKKDIDLGKAVEKCKTGCLTCC